MQIRQRGSQSSFVKLSAMTRSDSFKPGAIVQLRPQQFERFFVPVLQEAHHGDLARFMNLLNRPWLAESVEQCAPRRDGRDGSIVWEAEIEKIGCDGGEHVNAKGEVTRDPNRFDQLSKPTARLKQMQMSPFRRCG